MKSMGMHHLGELVWNMLKIHPDVTVGIKDNMLQFITDEKLREVAIDNHVSSRLKGLCSNYKINKRIF